jgi:curved DNA-binding protein CbpA
MASFKNYYQILSVDSTADAATIKAAFRRLALRHHPDRAKSARIARRYQEIREAYEVLSDPARRHQYDEVYRAQTALRPVRGGLDDPVARAPRPTRAAGLGISLDVLGLRLGIAVDAAMPGPVARRTKPAPRRGPPRRPRSDR